MKTKNNLRLLSIGTTVAAALVLAACGSLHDERYYWCKGQDCAVAPTVTPAAIPAPARRVSLNADALFAFDRSSTADMLPQGKAELDALARALRSEDLQVKNLTITGHADRLGDEVYNERLALKRANTVGDYLKGAGVRAPMDVRSMGKRDPVTRNCEGTQRTPGLIACLQPDRRVVVDIMGQAQN